MSAPVVYELWAGKQPLYVGVTNDLTRRLREHQEKHWIGGVTHLRLSFYQTRSEARRRESRRIYNLRPLHNVHHNPARWLDVDPEASEAWDRDWRQVDLDVAFGAASLGPTPSLSSRNRRDASLLLLAATRAAA